MGLIIKLHHNWSTTSSYFFDGKKKQIIHLGTIRVNKLPISLIFAHELSHYKLNQYFREVLFLDGEIEAWQYVLDNHLDAKTRKWSPVIKSIIRGYEKDKLKVINTDVREFLKSKNYLFPSKSINKTSNEGP